MNRSLYRDQEKGYYQNVILKSLNSADDNEKEKPRRIMTVDIEGENFPVDIDKYNKQWHNLPVSQGRTGTCWCFAATSFLESEIKRKNGKEVKLSEMYFVYWEYVERASEFVRKRGDIYFAEGSESNAVVRLMKKYGAVPLSVYPGKPKKQEFHDHSLMLDEMNVYLSNIKKMNLWDETAVISNIRAILDHYMGEPPVDFELEGKKTTPLQYLNEFLKINPSDYFSFMSTNSVPYNQRGILDEPDNWWRSDDYYNVHLNDFIWILKNALNTGNTACLCGDVSEPGHLRSADVSIVPSFDIPSDEINEDSREFRMYNSSTTDDHCIHFIGYLEQNGITWFAVKDSGAGGFDGTMVGYHFMHEDYIRLKMMNIMVEKNVATKVLDKIIK